MLQLVVYAGLQIPVGVLIDRFGPRALLIFGSALMFLGQFALAFAESVPSGIVARLLLGGGDAMIFASVLRTIPSWFPPDRAPLMTQLTGMLGQLGQIASAIPFAWALHSFGWRPAFLAASFVSLFGALAAVLFVRNSPLRRTDTGSLRVVAPEFDGAPITERIKAVWAHPATRLGMATHFTTSFSTMTFAMMWGFPYLTVGQALTGPQASAMMTLFAITSLVVGPMLGILTGRHPYRRSNMAIGVVAVTMIPWIVILALPSAAPLWLVAILMICIAVGGPGSAIGFDFARTFMPSHRLGTATGVINTGGFTGALLAILCIGVVLDLFGGYSFEAFRWAMAAQLPIALLGLLAIRHTRNQVRARLTAEEGIEVEPLVVVIARRYRTWRDGRP
ncbi:MFS family permease [Kineosphaera limosa]|uniref:Putative major facilitator superfamily transporter n=2 Tax=Kineosphaera TaxID=211469 RepID=K6WPU3_9MICO|nr:MFS transporter [Kineosphaera limosa]NYE02287.1 MFS family permease [Kineosphaera limosa]GAB94142.1 putative major facilitator superfamily transporter [Kineosphaera limosa NBRC 100340]